MIGKGTIQEYKSEAITVRFDPKICIHSGICIKGLGTVFDLRERRWINVDGATPEAIAEQVNRCPSGALSYELPVPRPGIV